MNWIEIPNCNWLWLAVYNDKILSKIYKWHEMPTYRGYMEVDSEYLSEEESSLVISMSEDLEIVKTDCENFLKIKE